MTLPSEKWKGIVQVRKVEWCKWETREYRWKRKRDQLSEKSEKA
jgi:hypothetical protein